MVNRTDRGEGGRRDSVSQLTLDSSEVGPLDTCRQEGKGWVVSVDDNTARTDESRFAYVTTHLRYQFVNDTIIYKIIL